MTSVQLNTENNPKQELTPRLPALPSHRTPTSQERKLSWCQINSPKNTFPRLRLAGVACKRRCRAAAGGAPGAHPGVPAPGAGLGLGLAAGTAGPMVVHGRQRASSFPLPPSWGPALASRKKDPEKAGAGSGLWTDFDEAGPAL